MNWLGGLLLLASLTAAADQRVSVCFNYGCYAQAEVVYREAQLSEVRALLAAPRDAAHERERIALAVGRLLGWAGEQTPISADRGGNYADDGVHGKMDCIDHSTTTTRLLRLIEGRGWLHHHQVLEPAGRRRYVIFDHYAAQIEERGPDGFEQLNGRAPARYVVDSWFFDNGQPAAIMPLARWLAGESPHGSE